MDRDGCIIASEYGMHRIQIFSPDGQFVFEIKALL